MADQKKKKKKGALTARAEYILYRAISAPIKNASPAKLRRWSDRTGRLAQRLLSKRADLVLRNLRQTFPEKSEEECRAIADACWKFFAGVVLRFVQARAAGSDDLQQELIYRPEWQELMSRGRPLIIVTAHYGDWESAIHILNRFDVPITVVARTLDNELLQRDLYEARLRSNVELADRRSAARALLRTLERNGVAVMLSDQAVRPREGIVVPFLGRPAWTTPAPARLSLRTGALIACVFATPIGDRIDVQIDEVIDPLTLPEEERDIEKLTRRLNDRISDRIRRDPDRWLWMHDRWKGLGGEKVES